MKVRRHNCDGDTERNGLDRCKEQTGINYVETDHKWPLMPFLIMY